MHILYTLIDVKCVREVAFKKQSFTIFFIQSTKGNTFACHYYTYSPNIIFANEYCCLSLINYKIWET